MKKLNYPFWYRPNYFIIGLIFMCLTGPKWLFPLGVGLMFPEIYGAMIGIIVYCKEGRKPTT